MMKKQISKKKLERMTVTGGDYRKAGHRVGQQQVTLSELRMLLEDDVKNLGRRESLAASASSCSSSLASSGRKRKSGAIGGGEEKEAQGAAGDAVKVEEVAAELKGQAAAHNEGEWLQRHISDKELDMIMSRDSLFPKTVPKASTVSPATGNSSSATLSGSAAAAAAGTAAAGTGGMRPSGSVASLMAATESAVKAVRAEVTSPVKVPRVITLDTLPDTSSCSSGSGSCSGKTGISSDNKPQVVNLEQDENEVIDIDSYNSEQGLDAGTVAQWEQESALDALAVPLEGEMYDIVAISALTSRSILPI
jgi:hypothetical protein